MTEMINRGDDTSIDPLLATDRIFYLRGPLESGRFHTFVLGQYHPPATTGGLGVQELVPLRGNAHRDR